MKNYRKCPGGAVISTAALQPYKCQIDQREWWDCHRDESVQGFCTQSASVSGTSSGSAVWPALALFRALGSVFGKAGPGEQVREREVSRVKFLGDRK